MGQIRKQTIQSSFLSYAGFLIGAINTYFFTKQGLFTPEQYGLTQTIISISQIVGPVATLGAPVFMGKFFPYYHDRLSRSQHDMLAIGVVLSILGAIIVFSACWLFEPMIIRQFAVRSPLLVKFYFWSLAFSFFYLCFLILESYLATLRQTVLPNFMKETMYRLCVSVLIALYAFQVISFEQFVMLFCSVYLLIVAIMAGYLLATGQLQLQFRLSKVTRRLRKQMVHYVSFVYGGIVINSIARQIDTLAIAGVRGLMDAGIYTLNQFSAAIIQVPYRALQAIAAPMIARHWKDKNHAEIERIYKRASINLLLISSFLFLMIWMNYDDGLALIGLDQKYAAGKKVFLILGIYNVIELTVGISSAVIATSPAWRFDFYSGLVLLLFSIPLNIYMAAAMGMEGVALATLFTFSLYNSIRICFVRYRFGFWPFSIRTLYAIVLIISLYLVTWFLFRHMHSWLGIITRSGFFTLLYISSILVLKLTPDLTQVAGMLRQKWRDR
ncbi:MAG: hypothetical protein P0Y53_16730 [Candidatus Pseudobacter hemicellulosilyticus]|uniref:O-antigen/teichoic acid export membrane protein n=1 Tax=Candidatus Pseudobacter hemicellulosilyticus TaxID=3121375 RepID=A0AAJ5WP12_9BACT|nr:MAG: hypothetical protein P0Y53_16730 [Pseudobacter sp.]